MEVYGATGKVKKNNSPCPSAHKTGHEDRREDKGSKAGHERPKRGLDDVHRAF